VNKFLTPLYPGGRGDLDSPRQAYTAGTFLLCLENFEREINFLGGALTGILFTTTMLEGFVLGFEGVEESGYGVLCARGCTSCGNESYTRAVGATEWTL